MGATLTGRSQGCRALAVSLAGGTPSHWGTAARLAVEALRMVLEAAEPLVLNLNVPDVPSDRVRGLRRARLAAFGAVQTTVSEVGRGYVKLGVADTTAAFEPDTDAALVAEGYAAATPLNPLCEAEDVRLPGLAAPAAR